MSWLTLKNKLKTKQPPEEAHLQEKEDSVTEILEVASQSEDFLQIQIVTSKRNIWLSYYDTLVDKKDLQKLVKALQQNAFHSLEDIKDYLTLVPNEITACGEEAQKALLRGSVLIQLEKSDETCLHVSVPVDNNREVTPPEIEFTVIGPKDSFVESIDVNISLVRGRLPIPDLKIKNFIIGSLTQTKVSVLYVDSIANETNVNTMIQRITDIQYDEILDSSFIKQMIEDQSWSPFPKFLETERPDRIVASLVEGKVAAVVDGSPQAISGPTTLIEYFTAFDDYFLGWHVSSALRLLRLFAVWFSIFATPLYVAILTFHVEIIPQDLLGTLITSRSKIPFPPIIEALILELAIELLREAGARLPTKVGQTIGIVGGIVIGTASVEASLTSNVLLIIIALAALASFTTPVYRMSTTIRFMRFPFIFAAQLWGLISLAVLFWIMLVHLLTITSLGRPYLAPLYPPSLPDFKDTFVRLPYNFQQKRPFFLDAKKKVRFIDKKKRRKKDIDEGV